MNKCLKITLNAEFPAGHLQAHVQKHARKLMLEGVARMKEDQVSIVVCGNKDNIDSFLDVLHKDTTKWKLIDIEIEPFAKDRDYRGVFRVIE